jgi:hypothetical protein
MPEKKLKPKQPGPKKNFTAVTGVKMSSTMKNTKPRSKKKKQPMREVDPNDDRIACTICGRRFNEDRI